MKNITWLAGGSGIVAFLVGTLIRIAGMSPILSTSSSGWWRASMALIAIGVFLALIEIRNALQKSSG